jgi:hypothetical protein
VQIATGNFGRHGTRVIQFVPRWLRRPVETAPLQLACMPARRIDVHAVVVDPPLDLSLIADRLNSLVRSQYQYPGPVEVNSPDGDPKLALSQLPDTVPEPICVKLGTDPLPIVGYSNNYGPTTSRSMSPGG